MNAKAMACGVLCGLFFVATWAWSAKGLANPQLQYEPATVELSGTLTERTFPGSPNYENVKSGDRPETYWILQLKSPIDVSPVRDDDINYSIRNVRNIQLVLSDAVRDPSLLRRNQRVLVVGTLYSAISGHHHTRVLIEVLSMQLAPGKKLPGGQGK